MALGASLDDDVDSLLGALDDEHEDASRRRAFRMTKTEGLGGCPAAKCEAAVDGDEKDESDSSSESDD